MRPATRDDLYRLIVNDGTVLHRGCGGAVEYDKHENWLTDTTVENYQCKKPGCGWWERAHKVLAMPAAEVERLFGVEPPKDDRVYKLVLNLGSKKDFGSTTHYGLRPATATESASYGSNPPDLWKLR
jgi:hypothetical protein